MIFYIIYRFGYSIANLLPIKIAYRLASAISDACYLAVSRDRNAVVHNLRTVMGDGATEAELDRTARQVFRNFAKYLVDFFRFSRIDAGWIKRFVKVEGAENVERARSNKKGVIMLSAHIGNWELGGFVVSQLWSPAAAVVLPHRNRRVNDFFTRQRMISNLRPIEIGMALRGCYDILRRNGLLAVLGDRDFSNNGFHVEFFGKRTLIPKGPAVFSQRLGSCIVPCFMIRDADDTFRLIMEKPIYPIKDKDEESAVKALAKEYSSIIETYVRAYPTQWYMFRDVWNNHGRKDSRSNTVL